MLFAYFSAGAKAKKVKKTYQNTTKEKQFLKAALAAKQRQDAAKRRKAQEETAGVQSSCAEDLWEDEGNIVVVKRLV